jgi:hypothetical protein
MIFPVVSLVVILHELLCAALFYGAFCRALWAGRSTKAGMRFLIKVIGMVACAGMAAPLAFGYQPDWFSVALLGLVVLEVVIGDRLKSQR